MVGIAKFSLLEKFRKIATMSRELRVACLTPEVAPGFPIALLRLFNVDFDEEMFCGLCNPFPRSVVSHFDLSGPGLFGLKAPDLHHR